MVSGDSPKMPRQGEKLSQGDVSHLRQWINANAPWPPSVVFNSTAASSTAEWWSLRALTWPVVPDTGYSPWVRTPVDAFVSASLQAKNLSPSPEADRRTLIRRLTIDLHGLPPTPEEVDSFVSDTRADAYEQLVEKLLASPRYGQRWGRHWLDVVHYGDTHGFDKDKRRDHAWPYRDYVIRALNDDKPYGQFVREQIAGDVLHPDSPEGLDAVGFVAAGPWDFVGHVELREDTIDKLKTRVLDRDDMVSSTFATFQSLTVGCARCHDHKFDPIPQKDYYRLQAVFAGVERGDRAYPKQPVVARRHEFDQKRAAILKRRADLEAMAPPADRAKLQAIATELAEIERQIKDLPPPNVVYTVVPIPPRPIHRLHRGNVEQPKELVTAGTLFCVHSQSLDLGLPAECNDGQRRIALANWLADPRNPLTWRSIVNRVWHYHFGRGLVDTPNDFGRNGSQPTHPALLDWLACTFRDNGASIKDLHRLMVFSAAYRQASRGDPAAERVDAENRLLWRMNRQRVDAETLRDSILAISGKLNSRMGGPGFDLFRFKDDHSPVYDYEAIDKIDPPSTWRRTVYRFVVRSVPNPLLDCLDCADPNLNVPVRNTTLTALQALAILNDPFVLRQAEYFADRLASAHVDVARRAELAYRYCFGRYPTAWEFERLSRFAAAHGWANACRLLFNANEFVFVD
jgi:hypothetical protein